MASKKISELTPVTPLLTDLVPLDRPTIGAGAPVTGQATLADIQALIGGGGGGGNEYWESSISGEIFATGSLVAITGSLHAQFLSSSNGLQITGSFTHGTSAVASSNSYAQGDNTTALGNNAHAEGSGTTSNSFASHAEGYLTNASNDAAHSEGYGTTASGQFSHAEGASTTALGYASHSEGGSGGGGSLIARGAYSHAEGYNTQAISQYSHAEGEDTRAGYLGYTVSNSFQDIDPSNYVFEIAGYGDVTGEFPGQNAQFIVDNSVYTYVGSNYDVGNTYTYITGSGGPGGGSIITRLQLGSPPIGADQEMGESQSSRGNQTYAIGEFSHSEGFGTRAIGKKSHSEGEDTTAEGEYSHAEGYSTIAKGIASHAEGGTTIARGDSSHAEGTLTVAYEEGSHAEGIGTIASGSWQHVQGKFNLRNNNFSIFVIGNGIADDDANRSDVVRVNPGTPGSGSLEVTGSLSVTVGMTGSLSYTPGNGTYWADPDPTNVKDALDRIAALLYTLNSNTPIP